MKSIRDQVMDEAFDFNLVSAMELVKAANKLMQAVHDHKIIKTIPRPVKMAIFNLNSTLFNCGQQNWDDGRKKEPTP